MTLFVPIFLKLSNHDFFPPLYLWMMSERWLCLEWLPVILFYSVLRISNYSWELTPIFIHKVISQIKHTQHLCSMPWWPEDAYWWWKFINQRQIDTNTLRVYNIFHTRPEIYTKNISPPYLSPLFYTKQSLTPTSLLWWIENSVLIRSNYLYLLTPILIREVRSQIKRTKYLCSMYWRPNKTNWVRQLKKIVICKLWVHKISFTSKNRTNTRKGFCFLYLTFVSI